MIRTARALNFISWGVIDSDIDIRKGRLSWYFRNFYVTKKFFSTDHATRGSIWLFSVFSPKENDYHFFSKDSLHVAIEESITLTYIWLTTRRGQSIS